MHTTVGENLFNPYGHAQPRPMLAHGFFLAVTLLLCSTVTAAEPPITQSSKLATRFDGTWMKDGFVLRYAANPPLTEAARNKFLALRPQDDPGARCVEAGLGRMMISPYPMQIIALPNHILIVSESAHNVRRIWTDTTEHEKDSDPNFYGDTVVKWDKEVMVVSSIGFNGLNYLDPFGYPMSEAMKIQERWRLLSPDKLQIEFTFDDPQNYSRPWSSTLTYSRKSDWRLGEYSCTENNRNDPDNPNNAKEWTSTDKPASYRQRSIAPDGSKRTDEFK